MKAVIMAGGKGTRLRPLTSHTPKPMVPLLNRPCMEYTIDLLKKHGITEIAVTLQYLPEAIRNEFGDGSRYGVSLVYFEETTPLGTAGSVKNCADFLDERFIVISGDTLTDIDLSAAVRFHEEKEALATLILTQVETPLEFGVVMTDENGLINRFLEKPTWAEVFSDMVNTGMYVFEPEVLSYIDNDREVDFSKEVFPYFLGEGKPMYGYAAEGYWSDIGSLEIYRQAQFDLLDGKVQLQIKAQEIAPRIFLESHVRIDSSVRLEGPVYIGENVHLQAGVAVGAYSILGSNTVVSSGTKLSQAIVWENTMVGKKTEIAGTTLCRNVQVGESVLLGEGAVIGDNCRLSSKSVVKAGVKIWPDKEIGESATVTTSLIYGTKQSKSLFGTNGIKGIGNVEVTPEFVTRLAASYAYLLRAGSRIALSACSHPFAQLLKHSIMTSLCSSGIDTVDFGIGNSPLMRYGVRSLQCVGGIHVYMAEPAEEKEIVIQFVDHEGLPVSRDMERKIENAYWQETYVRSLHHLGELHVEHQVQEAYLRALTERVDVASIQRQRFRLLIECEPRFMPAFLAPLFHSLGVSVQYGAIQEGVCKHGADLGIRLDKNGEQFALFSEHGEKLSPEQVLALQLLACSGIHNKIGLPVSAPMELEHLAQLLQLEVVRTKVAPRAMMEVASEERFHPMFDAVYSLLRLLSYLAKEEKPLSVLLALLPACHMEKKIVFCPWGSKGKVMRKMLEENKGKLLELVDGIKVYDANGWVLILPDTEDSHVKVISQGATAETAATLASSYAKRIAEYQ
ncbi:sugar phosphate nucleotidyltransferase [Brevibacillus choshinensis]|uniref:NTP transferase domain-containing protein n=1 Tax=Brevibacillus choshinensis TaxID=54911 RepID=A0ABX7FJC8_BRECH|nr:sugar phosphate nucleotidyltransferase [Brevibacillus choshinensis]QRG65720.1 NTP transferase domain-containing protein [Brevibacillus choshinensis]